MKILKAKFHDLGEGLQVNRALPQVEQRSIGPFIFWDHIGPVNIRTGKELSVRPHPHIGLATMTYLFDGAILHRDSLGNELVIRPGQVNWMTAGKGISHSERTEPLINELKGSKLHGIQVWVALPKDRQEIEPSFHHIPRIPNLDIDGYTLSVIAGAYKNQQSSVPIESELFYFDLWGKQSQFEFEHFFEGAEVGIYAAMESVMVNGTLLQPGQTAVCTGQVSIKGAQGSRTLLFGGPKLPEPRLMWWNFVHTDKNRIELAKQDWLEGRFGQVIHETERIPLPE